MNLAQEYYKATNIQLVTLEQLFTRNRSSGSDIDRQYKICFDMLITCSKLDDEVPKGTRLRLVVDEENPLRGLYDFANGVACDSQQEFVASISWGGYNPP